MFQTIRNAFKVKEIRKGLLYTFMMLAVIRFGSQLPIPGVDPTYFKSFFAQAGDALGFFNAMTGSSFENMSVLALSITPYITSSIIIQLLTIAIPKLEEMQKDGEDGRKKILEYTRYVTVGLALLQSSAMSIGFGRQGLLLDYNVWSVIVAIACMTAGSAFLMWIGEQITEKGVGNGISIVLLFNIISIMSFPVIIGQFLNVDYNSIPGKILMVLNSSSWLVPSRPKYSIGLIIYLVLLVAFAYFYTSITFNPMEVANNMKKQGGFIPGIRPGKPTSDYLNHILNYIVLIGVAGLAVIAVLPIAFSGIFTVSRISFSGTSLIIIVSVVLETIKSIESKMLVRNYKGFLND